MTQRLLLPLIVLVLIALGFGVFLSLDSGPQREPAGLTSPGQVASSDALSPADAGGRGSPRSLTQEEVQTAAELATTVVIPLKIELELIAATGRLHQRGEKPMHSDATARLRGSAHTAAGQGLEGQVEFVAGPNRGRLLELDAGGRFGANDLYPGLSLVHITGRGVPGAMREVLLREKREAQLNVGFGRTAVVFGQVFDRKNNYIAGATVSFDGQEVQTDEHGVFRFANVASGKVPVFISRPGFADLRSVAFITAGTTIALGKLKYTLEEAATLRISLPDRVGTGAPAQVFLSRPFEAGYGGAERKFPWHRKNPTTLYAGETLEIEGLPPGRVRIQVFQAGATVEPGTRETTLVPGKVRTEVFHMKAAPILSGRVLLDGKPAARALVQLEAPDVTGATVVARGGHLGRAQLEMDLFSHAPGARQKVLTGADGRFQFSACEELAGVRYLTARSADGRTWAGVAVQKGQREVDLQLTEVREGEAVLSIETATRFQALPVEYTVNGEPHAMKLLAGERLVIEGLPEGSWRYSAKWGGEVIQRPTPIELKGESELYIPLPEGAVQGQAKGMRDSMKPQHAGRAARG